MRNNEQKKYMTELIKRFRDAGQIVKTKDLVQYIPQYVSENNVADVNYERNLSIICAYINKVPVIDIADRFKLSTSTIYNIFQRYNIKSPKEEHEERERNKRTLLAIRKMVIEGNTVDEIAKKLNVNPSKINIIINRHLSELYKAKRVNDKNKTSSKSLVDKAPSTALNTFESPRGSGLIDKEDTDVAPVVVPKAEKEGMSSKKVEALKQEQAKFNRANFNPEGTIVPEKIDEEEYKVILKILGNNKHSLTKEEREILSFLRATLEYSAKTYQMADYSKDNFLVPDYILPVDIMIMKDIQERYNKHNQSAIDIAKNHLIDEGLVIDVINGELERNDFRKEYFKSIARIMTAIRGN